jgi:hypothetical protein
VTARAYVRPNIALGGVEVALLREHRDGGRSVRQWPNVVNGAPDYRKPDEAGVERPDDFVQLVDDEARALYEALAEHYGHGANDVRSLRRDHDAERARVDKLTDALIVVATTPPEIVNTYTATTRQD